MPVYEYQCKACDHEFEREQRISEDPVKKCPRCKKMKVKRLISRTSFVLKGDGWYNDLYSSSGGKKKSESSDSSGDGGSSDGSEKSDKPDKSESKDKKTGGAGDGKGKSGDKKSAKGSKAAA